MKIFAIKTSKGYLATQGYQYWFEEKPVGWAQYTSADIAGYLAGKIIDEYEIVEIS